MKFGVKSHIKIRFYHDGNNQCTKYTCKVLKAIKENGEIMKKLLNLTFEIL